MFILFLTQQVIILPSQFLHFYASDSTITVIFIIMNTPFSHPDKILIKKIHRNRACHFNTTNDYPYEHMMGPNTVSSPESRSVTRN